jgi:hypothetical protein
VEKNRTKGRRVLKCVCMGFDCNEVRLAMRLISVSESEEEGTHETAISEGKKRCKNGSTPNEFFLMKPIPLCCDIKLLKPGGHCMYCHF